MENQRYSYIDSDVDYDALITISGLDAHQDTPVEILHVVLLGFMKYMWQDLVQNQIDKDDVKKKLLITHLSSFNVTGLTISPLAGCTLVQYCGSLTGCDFQAIAQVAPFVAYDFISPECLETWVALSKLIPLIWQPTIDDLESHCASLLSKSDSGIITYSSLNRNSLNMKSNTSCSVQLTGQYNGSTNQNSTFLFISLIMFITLDQQSSLQLRHLSYSMPSSMQKAFIQINMHLHVTSLMPLLKGITFIICSVVANSLSFFLGICHILKSKHALPVLQDLQFHFLSLMFFQQCPK